MRTPDEPDAGTVLCGATVVSGGRQQKADVLIQGGSCVAIEDRIRGDWHRIDLAGRYLTPGLVDIHVHGAIGASFDAAGVDTARGIAVELARHGVTTFMATLSSQPIPRICEVLSQLDPSRWESAAPTARLAGVHLEGPYLSPSQRGAHAEELLRTPNGRDTALLMAHVPALRMMTLAPELPGALDLIRTLTAAGVIVAVGHSAAKVEELRSAQAAGASHFTHLWSGMNGVHRIGPWRHAGVVEQALSSSDMTADVIADGAHLPAELLEIARRCLPGRLCLISDASEGAGLPEGTVFGSQSYPFMVQNGVAEVVGEDSFAGSATLLDGMVRHVVKRLGWGVPEAITMATELPAAIVGMQDSVGTLAAGRPADMTVFDDDLRVVATMLDGRWVHDAGGLVTGPAT